MKRPVVELGDCVHCDLCSELCPSVFIQSDSGYIHVSELAAYPEAEVNEAIKYCPRDCIDWEED